MHFCNLNSMLLNMYAFEYARRHEFFHIAQSYIFVHIVGVVSGTPQDNGVDKSIRDIEGQ
jgi:hypothetical protein